MTNKVVKLYIEGYRKYYDDDYVYNPTTGVITLSSPVLYGQRFIVEAYPVDTWDECNLTTSVVGDFPYDFPFDF